MEVHFYESGDFCSADVLLHCDWVGSELAIGSEEVIHTTQMGLLESRLFDLGYRIFVHTYNGMYEIKLGQNDCTDKEIRKEHNLFKMWLAGAFKIPETFSIVR